MAFHKCTATGCAFYLPDNYPLPRCPWHMVPGNNVKTKLLVTAGACALLAAGYGASTAAEAWRQARIREKVEAARTEWRKRKGKRRTSRIGVTALAVPRKLPKRVG